MSPRCSVCSHPDIADLNAQLVEGGASLRGIARKYLLSEDALQRHRKNHLPKAAIQEAVEEREVGHRRKLKILEHTLFLVLKRRLRDEDDALVLRAHGQLLRHYEFELRLAEVEEIKTQIAELTEMVRDREEMR